MKRILILTIGSGDSNYAAARNVCAAVESLSNEASVEVIDLFDRGNFGSLNRLASKACRGLVRFAPGVWGGIYSLLDQPQLSDGGFFRLSKVQRALGNLLQETQPDVVVSTYPLYASMIRDLYRDHAERPFRLITIITDSTEVDPAWLQAPSDVYCVPNDATAAVLRRRSIAPAQVQALGFPVSVAFSERADLTPSDPGKNGPYRILYLVNSKKKKFGKSLTRLLKQEEYHLTVALGPNADVTARFSNELRSFGERVRVISWTNQMPQLLMTHHLLLGDAGSATLQEAIAARCPIIANQQTPPQGEGNARLLLDHDIGVVASRTRQMAEWVHHAFRRDARVWRRWRENLGKLSRPAASLRIGRLILDECDSVSERAGSGMRPPLSLVAPRQLLCDFHIHTNYSDGVLSVAEVIDFYGRRRFDCICITDHLADSRRLIGKLGKLSRLSLSPSRLAEYFEVIERERRRAWRKYNMLVMTGLEFNKDGLTKKSSAHLLGIDLTSPILDCLDLPETIAQIHAQSGLAVASHPHIMKSEWGKNTLYLWENQEQFTPLLDAWEIANRNNMFNPVSAKRLPYLANSDFHKPRHIYSWKTLVSCEKNATAIKDCIRRNERIAITLYREDDATLQLSPGHAPAESVAASHHSEEDRKISLLIPAA
jgi:processive 1,2-diacylglycerol beta-glucosyltransferase